MQVGHIVEALKADEETEKNNARNLNFCGSFRSES